MIVAEQVASGGGPDADGALRVGGQCGEAAQEAGFAGSETVARLAQPADAVRPPAQGHGVDQDRPALHFLAVVRVRTHPVA